MKQSSMKLLKDQYWFVFIGQALIGMGNPMAVSVPTKVSQHWFRESQRTFATIILAMSQPLGIVLGKFDDSCRIYKYRSVVKVVGFHSEADEIQYVFAS